MISSKGSSAPRKRFLLILPFFLASTHVVTAQFSIASFVTGVTDSGEQCVCELPNGPETPAPETEPPKVSSDIVLSNVDCNPNDIETCKANCASIHGIDQYLSNKCCAHAGQSASLLAFEEDSQWVPRLEEFNKCTGARVRLEYLPGGEDEMANALRNDLGDDASHDQGNAAGQGIFDAYIVQAPWLWPVVNGLENLSPKIRENADTVKFLDINPASRSAVSYNGTVRALPLDTDYIALGWRQDVFHKYDIPPELSPPRTIQDLAKLAEQLHGEDFNDDGEGDWGVCLTPQVNYFYAFVAPLMQSALMDVKDGTPTGQNMFFNPDTFEPLIHQPAFKTAVEHYYKIIRNSNCGEQLANGGKCDRKSAFPTGRCAMVISMPGTLTKMLLDGAKYAPVPRVDEETGEELWNINNMTLGEGGTYWGRRAPFPGSKVVQDWNAEGYPLVKCKDNNGDNCPLADDDGINFAPFFAEGGEAYALNGRQSKPAAKEVMWDLFTWLSELPETELPLSGQYRKSHLDEGHRESLEEGAGWPSQMVDDIFNLLGQYFKSEEEGGNPVQDLLMLGFPEYMDALDEELHVIFLGVKPDSTGGVFNRDDPHQSIDPYLDPTAYDQAFNVFIKSLETRYSAISASISGGRMGQLQRWRSSLNLPWRTEEELCVAALASNNLEAFDGLQCSFFVDFESLCQTQPEAVAYYDPDLCDSLKPADSNLAVILPSVIIPLIVVALLGGYCYGEYKKRQAEVHWQIKPEEITFSDPPVVLGSGRFGQVLLATYRGGKVAVKTIKPALPIPLKKSARRESLGGSQKGSQHLDSYKDEELESCPVSSTHEPTSGRSSVGGSRGSKSVGGSSARASLSGMKQSIAQGWSQLAKNDPLNQHFVKEIRMLTKLQDHRNIVGVMGAVIHGTQEPKLVLEYMERGSLYDFLKSDAPIGGQLILKLLKDVSAGVMFLHNANPQIVHSDLKASNILVDKDFRAKVSDFGWGAAGTPYWTAPEVLRRESPYTVQSDVYAFGVTMYEIYARTFPYQGEDPATVLKQLRDRSQKKRPATPTTMSSPVKNMMRDCLTHKPHKRPTMDELVARIDRFTVEDVEYQVDNTKSSEIYFPANVFKELGKGHTVEQQTHENVSVVYCEIVGFGNLASELPPLKIANLLQRFNDRFDGLAEHHGVFKNEMMGAGAWLGATNCIQHQPTDHVTRCARFAIDTVKHASSILLDEDDISKGFLQVQAAFVSGQVHGNVVGSRNPRYSLSGPAVEAAQCLASEKCDAGKILCTEAEQTFLKEKAPDIVLEMKSRIFVAGLGAQFTFWVNTSEYARPK